VKDYQNGKTAWIRMTSGVDIVDQDLANSFGVTVGNQLAKKLDSRNFSHVEVIELGTYSDLEKAAKKTFDTSELPF